MAPPGSQQETDHDNGKDPPDGNELYEMIRKQAIAATVKEAIAKLFEWTIG